MNLNYPLFPKSTKLKDRCARQKAGLALQTKWSKTTQVFFWWTLTSKDRPQKAKSPGVNQKLKFTESQWHRARQVSKWSTW